ncbi:MAG: hypothetical protein CM15mV52_0960 [uncultured marine virus]|nr:MAG: hypothetical protein CM15mV52_0960 [uncultured marine virus]|tara:strand:- start:4583 stop:4969 length:387 start_codon:yes stop_codon:yes gene_type:complete
MSPLQEIIMTEKKIWSMDELVALTDEVQENEVEYRNKMVHFQFCELTEQEEPKFTGVSEDMPEEEKLAIYQEIGSNRVVKMLEKANEKNPEGPVITAEQWVLLPTTLRYAISNSILGVEEETKENFRD